MRARLRRFWRKRPVFLMAAGILLVGAVESWCPNIAWIGVLLVAFFIVIVGGWRSGLVAACLAVFMVGHMRWQGGVQQRDEKWFSEMGIKMIEGRLLEDANGSEGVWSAVARLRGGAVYGKKVNWIGNGEAPPAGTELRASGYFQPLENERNPGTLERSERLRNLGVVASFKASEMRSEQWTGPFSTKAAAFRKSFREAVVAGLNPEGTEAQVILAVVLGERARDSIGLVRRFRESGTLHVFTVSGLHVAMLGTLVWFGLKWIGIPRRWAIPLIVAVMFGYVWLTGNGPAAVRAAWMGTVVLGAFMLRRRPDLLNSLGVVLLVALLLDPRMIRMPGVQLSYGVVAAIGIATALTRRWFTWIAVEDSFMPMSEIGFWPKKWLEFRQKIAEALSVSTAASIGSTPLTIVHFGLITPVSVIATVVLVAQVYVLLAVALVSAMVSPAWGGASVFLNKGNAIVAGACAKTAGFFASIPGASMETTVPHRDTLVIYDLNFGSSAACFTPEKGSGVLIDSGGKYSLQREIGPSLRRLGMKPDSVIFTHADAGHVVAPELLNEMFEMRQVALGMPHSTSSVAKDWENFSDGAVKIAQPMKGDKLPLGNGAWAEILLSPHENLVGSVADDRSLVLKIHWKGWKILWLGDAGRLSEVALLESGVNLDADLIVAGIHETDLSLTPAFVSAVGPQAIVVASPAGSAMDSMRKIQVGKWRKSGITVFDQAETGGLTLTVYEGLVVEGFFNKSRSVLRH